ncbi:MAG: SDR family NAD(P)-dependent oxidoreductase [Solirubrobacterales bacterium]|nr:SDR family NAD(P)-dependent oxidoreductase [Solirubrobacterales bacterium]
MNLAGASVLVTGANRGIGRALVTRLAAEPARLVLAGMRSVEKFEPVALSPEGAAEVRPVQIDLSSRESVDASCERLGQELERIDVLFNNAGLVTGGLLEEQDMEQVYAMFQVNLVAVAHLTQRVLPGMLARRYGAIVNNASISAYAYFPAASTYAASKAGVVALTEALRRELRGTGVRAMHLVTPGVTTDMLQRTEDIYGRHLDTSGWEQIPPEQWADQAVEAVKAGRRVVNPPGKSRLAMLAARGPAWLLDQTTARVFSRSPRG